MDADAKKTALRMIPYGIYVLTAKAADGTIAAATVNWVTQTAFEPPLVAIGVKADSGAYGILKETGHFALNMLGKGQQKTAFAFFKPTERDGGTINGHGFTEGTNGAPILDDAHSSVQCRVVDIVEPRDPPRGPRQVPGRAVATAPAGRPGEACVARRDMGVSQDVKLAPGPDQEEPNISYLFFTITRNSGEFATWHRMNMGFLKDLRKQLLIWRLVTIEEKLRLIAEGEALLRGEKIPQA